MINLISVLSIVFLILGGCNNMGQNALDNQINDQDRFPTISSDSTSMGSNQFPHTVPVEIQKAKYGFYFVDQEGQGQTIKVPEDIAQKLPQNFENLFQQDLEGLLTPADIGRLFPNGIPEQPVQQVQQQPRAAQPAPKPQQPGTAKQQPTPAAKKETQAPEKKAQPTQGITEIEAKVIELTNVERRNNGLTDLKGDSSLSNVAREKSRDMQTNNYFSHTSPTYGSPFDMMRDFGVSYRSAGENIAMGQQTPEQVVQEWMDSPGHRQNILSGDYTHIGVGYNSTGHYWTQMFIRK